MCFSAIETLSREISRHSAARTIEDCDFSTAVEMTIGRVALVPLEDWDFSTLLPTVEMTMGRRYHSKSAIPVRPFPMPMGG